MGDEPAIAAGGGGGGTGGATDTTVDAALPVERGGGGGSGTFIGPVTEMTVGGAIMDDTTDIVLPGIALPGLLAV